jgi:hypothetical protein
VIIGPERPSSSKGCESANMESATDPIAFRMFHTCLIVPNLEQAMEELLPVHPSGWAEVQETEVGMEYRGATQTVLARYTYSKEEPSHLELIERVPDSVWDADPTSFHHIGYWVPDLFAASELLEARGYRRDALGGPTELDEPIFTYHLSPSGARVELVSESFEAELVAWLRGE